MEPTTLRKAVICDLDGTLAIIKGRSPYNQAECEKDLLNLPVYEIIQNLHHPVILVSGRHEDYRPQTERWLYNKSIRYEALFMRKSGDMRKDFTIKKEIYEKNIKDVYDIFFVLDDRDQVVDMWRKDLGLTCFQVNYGNF